MNPVVARFEDQWRDGNRPWIKETLEEIAPEEREQVVKQLVLIDIRYRLENGEQPQSSDYLPLGPKAASLANVQIQADADLKDGDGLEATTDGRRPADSTFGPTVGSEKKSQNPKNNPGQKSGFIGPYKLLKQIGEGGMGSVWLAEQHEPVRRRVAIKVIRGEIDSEASIGRFEAERQAIALMEHQNIAKILDAGTTESGSPFFAMELVDGIPLQEYCDSRKLGMRERLELMIPVCRAIHHAHQKGIIHRDLKHSNVLVTQYDGKPVPKVIDFGLAKACETKTKLTEETIFTGYGQVVGTLQYMSPEQAELDSNDVDTRTDIYSLGIMLYKLLTGTTPLDRKSKDAKSLFSILQVIREQVPQKPSDRIATLEPKRLKKTAANLGVRPEKLIQQVKTDVDWIVMKAIETDRERRYESANGLAVDIERFLNDEEVRACPPSAIYRLEKFYKRNRKLVAAFAAVLFVLVMGVIGTAYGMFWALSERRTAKQEATKAVTANKEAQYAKTIAETRLRAIRIKSAYSDWQLGNVESAWQGYNSLEPDDYGWETQYLKKELSSSREVLYGHAQTISSIDASDDGKLIASCSNDNSVKVWDVKTKELLHTVYTVDLPYHVCFSPDSKLVAYSDRANQVTVFDSQTGANVRLVGKFKEDITCLAFGPEGTELLLGTGHQDLQGVQAHFEELGDVPPMVRVIKVADGAILAELEGHTKAITGVDLSNDGKTVISCSEDSTIRMWSRGANGFQPVRTLTAHYPKVNQVRISPSGKSFASCGEDSTIRIWELETGHPIGLFSGHNDSVNDIRYIDGGQKIISASSDQTARVWNTRGEELRAFQGHFEKINSVCYSQDDRVLFTASEDHTIRYYRLDSRSSTRAVQPHDDVVWQTDFSPDGKRLVSVSEDGGVSILDTQTGDLVAEKADLKTPALCVAHSPVDDVFVVGSADAKLRVFDSNTGVVLQTIDAHDDYIWDVTFSDDGKLAATASSDNSFKIWTTDDWAELKVVQKAHEGEVGSVRFSRDGRQLLTASDDKKVRLWDTSSYKLVAEFTGHQFGVWRAIFCPTNPNIIASSSYDGEVIIWDVRKNEPIGEPIQAHQDQIAGLAFTTDGTRIVTASDDQSIRIWEVSSGIELFVLRDTDNSSIVAAAFSKDGMKLATGNQDGWVTIRTATTVNDPFQPFLPMDAFQIARDVGTALVTRCRDQDDFREQLILADKCCKHYPSYVTFTDKGIAQYRLGLVDDAIVSLCEAQRLEPISYGEPDLPPYIEAFLTLAYLDKGQIEKSKKMKALFLKKANVKIWNENEPIPELIAEIEEAYRAHLNN